MALFNVQIDDGRTLHIDAQDENEARATAEHFLKNEGSGSKTDTSAPVTAGGLAKAAGTGLVQGLAGLAGLPGDIEKYGSKALHWLNGTPGPENPDDTYLPNSSALQKLAADNLPLHAPQNTAENYAASIGSMVPAAVGGPEGIASRLLTRAVVPGVASEAAGEATEGTPFEPVARAAGAALSPAVLTKLGAMRAAAKIAKAAPDADTYLDAAESQYNAARQSNVPINPQTLGQRAAQVRANLGQRGLVSSKIAPEATDVLDDIAQRTSPTTVTPQPQPMIVNGKQIGFHQSAPPYQQAPNPLTMQEMMEYRGQLKAGLKSLTHPEDRAASSDVMDMLNDVLEQHLPILADARQNYNAGMDLQRMGLVQSKAEANAAAANSGNNSGNALRQAYKSYAFGKDARGLNAAETAQLARIYNGTLPGNLARYAGNMLGGGGGIGSLAVAGAGAYLGGQEGEGSLGAIGLPALGLMMRGRANASVARQVAKLQQMRAARAPLSVVPAAASRPNSIVPASVRALLAMSQGNAGAQTTP
jgi:hypothetical protein